MTKKELIEALKDYHDDIIIKARWGSSEDEYEEDEQRLLKDRRNLRNS